MIGSSEFQLAVQCCQANFRARAGAVAPPADVDWDRFLALVRFHRIEGLAWNALGAQSEQPALREAANAIAARNLRAAAECGALAKSFAAAGIPLLFVKGLALGALAYSRPLLKSGVDIDLLIDRADIAKASNLLRAHGWAVDFPESADATALAKWHRWWKESVWLKRSPALQMDLHTRLADNPRLIPGIDVHSPSDQVEVAPGLSLLTLARDELVAYLAVHGASSAWFRLKWISDFAALLDGRSGDEIERLYRRSQELGAARAAGQALLLADGLFGTLARNGDLRREIANDGATQRLFATALRLLTRDPVEPTESFLGTLPIRVSQFRAARGARSKLDELVGQVARVVSGRSA